MESKGLPQEVQLFFHTEDVELPSAEQLWQCKQEKLNSVQKEFTVITVSQCYKKLKKHNHTIVQHSNCQQHPTHTNQTRRRPSDT